MAEDPKRPTSNGDIWVHHPLPYIAVLRVSLTEDGPATQQVWRGYAYSVLEATVQAMGCAGGTGLADERVKVVHIAPDIDTYVADLASNKYGLRNVYLK